MSNRISGPATVAAAAVASICISLVLVAAVTASDTEWLACGARSCWEIEPIIFVESAFGVTETHKMRSELGCFLARDIALREHVDAAACFPNKESAKKALPALRVGGAG